MLYSVERARRYDAETGLLMHFPELVPADPKLGMIYILLDDDDQDALDSH